MCQTLLRGRGIIHNLKVFVAALGAALLSGNCVQVRSLDETSVNPVIRNQKPFGVFERIEIDQQNRTCRGVGWALDPDDLDRSINVHVFVDLQPVGPGSLALSQPATLARPDIQQAYNRNGSFSNYGFSLPIPFNLCTGRTYLYLFVWAEDTSSIGNSDQLAQSPQRVGQFQAPGTGAKFITENAAPFERTSTIKVTIPFARGQVPGLAQLSELAIQNYESETTWQPLAFFDDGSLMAAQAQTPMHFNANQKRTGVRIVDTGSPSLNRYGNFQPHSWTAARQGNLDVKMFIEAGGVEYIADLGPGLKDMTTGDVLENNQNLLVRSFDTYFLNTSAGLVYPSRYPAVVGQRKPIAYARVYVTHYRAEALIQFSVIVSNAFMGSDNPNGSAHPQHYPTGDFLVTRARMEITGVDHAAFKYPEFNSPGALTLSNGRYRSTLFNNQPLPDGTGSVYHVNLGFIDPAAGPVSRAQMQNTFRAADFIDVFSLADIDSWLDKTPLSGGISRGPNDAATQARAERDRCVGDLNNRRALGYQHFDLRCNIVRETATTGTPRNFMGGLLDYGGLHAIQGGEPTVLLAGLYHFWSDIHRRHPHVKEFSWARFGGRFVHWDSACLSVTPGARAIGSETLGRRDLYFSQFSTTYDPSRDPYLAIRGSVTPGAVGANWHDPEHFTAVATYTAALLLGSHMAKDYSLMASDCAKSTMYRNGQPHPNSVTRYTAWGIQMLLQAYTLAPTQERKQTIIDYLERVWQQRYDPTHPSKTHFAQRVPPRHAWFSPPWQHQQDVEMFMAWQNGYLVTEMLGVENIIRGTRAMDIAEDTLQSIQYSRVQNYTDPRNQQFVANGFRKYTLAKIFDPGQGRFVYIAPDTWDHIYVEWGGSPLGGVNTTIPTGMYYLKDLARTQTQRNLAAELSALWANPSRWSKWQFRIPERNR